MTRVTITVPAEIREAVDSIARDERESFSATTTELVKEQISKQRQVSPFAALIGAWDDPGLPNAIDMEQALKEIWMDAANRHRR